MTKKLQLKKILNFFLINNYNLPIPRASIKNVQVTEEAFSSQKRSSNTSKHELLKSFLLLCFIFALLDPDPLSRLNPDPTATLFATLFVCSGEVYFLFWGRRDFVTSLA
jgi:hypothetical protein